MGCLSQVKVFPGHRLRDLYFFFFNSSLLVLSLNTKNSREEIYGFALHVLKVALSLQYFYEPGEWGLIGRKGYVALVKKWHHDKGIWMDWGDGFFWTSTGDVCIWLDIFLVKMLKHMMDQCSVFSVLEKVSHLKFRK